MSAGITNTDNVFSVRELMWWDVDGSHTLADYPTRTEAQAIAHPWNPTTEPLYRAVPSFDDNGEPVMTYVEVEDAKAVVRDDNDAYLGTVSKGIEPVSNDEMYDIAEVIQGEGSDVLFETGGSLHGGQKVWLLLRLNEPINIKGDPNGTTLPFFALQNDNTGKGAFRGQGVQTRIVCANTSKMADLDAEHYGTEFVFWHTMSVHERIEGAKAALAGWRENVSAYNRMMEHLIGVKVTKKQRELFVTEFVPMPVGNVISDRVVNNIETARQQIRDVLAGPTCEGVDLTAYGLVQAAIEYGQHVRRANSQESRFKRAFLKRDALAADAVTLAEAAALA
jgi:phage/plasmid-like protein (TIGR03299 family)